MEEIIKCILIYQVVGTGIGFVIGNFVAKWVLFRLDKKNINVKGNNNDYRKDN